MKICVIGCGLRTPLLIHGLVHSGLRITRVVLHDISPARAGLMQQMGAAIADGTAVQVSSVQDLEEAIQDSAFVISSIRVGDMETRARDERLAVECGFAGQETTGPAGFAMALRTIPISIQHAQIVHKCAPNAWLINFTNPAGMITQAITTHTSAKVVGICDTPGELAHQIARVLGEPTDQVDCDYFGLNHLGWMKEVRVRGEDVMPGLIDRPHLLRDLYPAELFSPSLIRELGLIPTEYLLYYYNQHLARTNQVRAGITRGEELKTLNSRVLEELEGCVNAGDPQGALDSYRGYLNRRNASYMRLDGSGESAFEREEMDLDPFACATGYHRIAVDAIRALSDTGGSRVILNVPNDGAMDDLAADDIVEVPCIVDRSGARPTRVGRLPESVRGLVLSVKNYERLTIQAALENRRDLTTFALMANPIVGSWDLASSFVDRLEASGAPSL